MAYADYKSDVDRLVVGPRLKDDCLRIEEAFHESLADFYQSQLFFIPSARLLRNHVKPITDGLEHLYGLNGFALDDFSTRTELNALARGEAVSLFHALRMDRTLQLLAQHGHENTRKKLLILPENPADPITPARVRVSLSTRGIQPVAKLPRMSYVTPNLGIIPSIYTPTADRLKRIHDRSGLGQDAFSRIIFDGDFPASYKLIMYDGRRITRNLALAIAERARARFHDVKGLTDEDFDPATLFKVAKRTPSKETPLAIDEGNMVPGRSHYLQLA